jgi:membrane protein required for colicin V production
METPLTVVDFAVLGILLISGLFATYRGFLNETLSIVAYAIAAVGAVVLAPLLKPLAHAVVGPDWLAYGLSLVALFLVLLIPLSFVSFRISESVQGSPIGPLDRSLGFVFGVGRGLVLVGAGYLVFTMLAQPKDHPEWVRNARLLPVIRGTADVLRSLGGTHKDKEKDKEDAHDTATAQVTEQHSTTTPAKPAHLSTVSNESHEGSGDPGKTYGDGDRRALDQLVHSASKPK